MERRQPVCRTLIEWTEGWEYIRNARSISVPMRRSIGLWKATAAIECSLAKKHWGITEMDECPSRKVSGNRECTRG